VKSAFAMFALVLTVFAAILVKISQRKPPPHIKLSLPAVEVLEDRTHPPPQANIGGVAMIGTLTIFGAQGPEIDSFVVVLPDTDSAQLSLLVSGVQLPLPTARDLAIPPWVKGQPAQLPGVAWHAFMYDDRDTLSMWGYDAGGGYVGHLRLSTPDATHGGHWHSYGPAKPIQTPVALNAASQTQVAAQAAPEAIAGPSWSEFSL
jgi:hypothetical protein